MGPRGGAGARRPGWSCGERRCRSRHRCPGVVGTLLSAVNQGDVLLAGDASAATVIKVGVNYVVPFTVASIGFLGARRAPLDGPGPGREGGADTGRQDPPP